MTAPSSNEYEPGMEVVPGYTLISRLGSGMAGDVWVAQAAGGIKVAIKIVRSLSVLGGRKELKALKTVRGVHHPNLCPLFGFWTKDADGRFLEDGETEELTFDSLGDEPIAGESAGDADSQSLMGTMALGQHQPPTPPSPEPDKSKPKVTAEQLIVVMGLGDCTLFDRLRYVRQEAGIAPDDESTCYGVDAAEAIRYLKASASAIDLLNREHQIYHCDIKPQNILLVGGEAQVCDFGLAKRIEGDMRQTQQAFATPAYAPPEVLHNEGYSRWVDQYSLAVTYYELRTGLLPFDITTHANMLVAKATGKLDLTALLPSERKVMQKALNRIPEQRYGSCTEFISALAVASGVEKGGGITAKKLIAGVAALVLILALGMGGWWQLDRENFEAFWTSKNARAAERLRDVRTEFEATEGLGFESSYKTLDLILDKTAEVAQDATNEDAKAEALSLFAEAANRLVQNAHKALDSPQVKDELLAQIRDEFRQFDSGASDDLIRDAIESWSTSKTASLQKQFTSFDTTLCSGQMRLAYRSQTAEPDSKIDALRTLVDASPQSFDSGNGGFARAALLPLFVSLHGDDLSAIDGARWLSLPLVDDILRAQSVAIDSIPEDYRERWLEIRSAFTTVSSAHLSGSNDVASEIRERVRKAFPKLHVDSMMVRLRTAADAGRWGEIDSLRAEIPATNLSSGDRRFLDVVDAYDAYSGQRDEFVNVVQKLRGVAGEFNDLRLAPSFNAYLAQFAEQQWESALAMQTVATLPLEEVEWVETQLSVSLPEKLFAARLVARLTSTANPLSAEETAAYTSQLESQDWVILQAAMRLDSALRSPIGDGTASAQQLRADEKLLAQSDDVGEWRVPDWLHHCLSCASVATQAIQGGRVSREELARLLELQKLIPPDGLKRVGSERVLSLTERCVQAAVAVSGVDDNDLVESRYADPAVRAQAGTFLELGTSWEEAGGAVSKRLASERFLLAIVEGQTAGQAERIEVPQILREDIVSGDLAEYSIPFLRELVTFGLQRCSESPQNHALMNAFVLRPTIAVLEHPSVPQFGQPGEAPEKQAVCGHILEPVAKAVTGVTVANNGIELDRRLPNNSQLNREAAQRVCRLFAEASMDSDVEQLFGVSEEMRRVVAYSAAFAASNERLDAEKRHLAWLIAAYRGSNHSQISAADIRFAAASARRVGTPRPEAAILESRAIALQADKTQIRRPVFEDALQVLESEIDRLEGGPNPERFNRCLMTLHNGASALGVRIAFEERVPSEKETILSRASKRADQALELFSLPGKDEMLFDLAPSEAEMWINKGNAMEDLAHYCEPSQKVQLQRFDRAEQAFRKALEKGPTIKVRYSLARCLFRHAEAVEDPAEKTRLFLSARASIGDEPRVGFGGDPSEPVEWYLWRAQIEKMLGNRSDQKEFAQTGYKLAQNPRCHPSLKNLLVYEYAFSLIDPVDRSQREKAIDLILNSLDVGTYSKRATNLDLAVQVQFLYREQIEKLGKLLQVLESWKTVRPNWTEDAAFRLCRVSAFCTRELVLPQDKRIRGGDSGTYQRAVACVASMLSQTDHRAYEDLANRFASFAELESADRKQKIQLAVDLADFIVDQEDSDVFLLKICSSCQTAVLVPMIMQGTSADEFRNLIGSPKSVERLVESMDIMKTLVDPTAAQDVNGALRYLRKL